jgi:aspartyl-tRNA(Asn)/glutamyl-tRNA(Gln) amidotransferase subunit A
VSGLRAAWSSDLGFAVVDPEVEEVARAAAETLMEAAGLTVVDVDVRLTDPVRTWMSAGGIDVWLNIDEDMWPSRADDLTPFPRRGYEATYDYPVRKFARTHRRRWQLEEDCAALFRDIDVLLTPATAIPAFAAEGPEPKEIAGKEIQGGMSVPFTMLANLCWNPACSVPAGLSADGLPIGLQVMGRRHADDVVLRLARIFEQAQPWPRLAPSANGAR